ncbi:MAG: tyrosine-type recombinase/integrase [Proteobacteria bacterium]|nr:tyrosine-type recombinase/integrase [Pseudomonadota bacterium]
MPRRAQGLSAQKVAKAKPGRYGDGAGLYLLVRSPEAKFWVFRYVRDGRMREMGLGPAAGRAPVTLSEARGKASALFKAVRDGHDPLADRKAERAARLLESAKAITFGECAAQYIAAKEAAWKNDKHRQQWENTLATYAEPEIGSLAVQAVDTGLILKVLEPIWTEKPETASRLRGRLEAILDWAGARGYRNGENPARWKGHLDKLLADKSRVRRVKHHAALPYDEVASFLTELRRQEGTAARLLEFTILTGTRTGEALGARWSEVDLGRSLWVIPPERMKAGREHRVPLSGRAVAILNEMDPLRHEESDFVFPGVQLGKPLSNMAMLSVLRRMKRDGITVHGFRSSFRDWAAEQTNWPNEVVEMALAHAVGNKVEAAYRRGDMFEKRRRLMDAWAEFCAMTQKTAGTVTKLRAEK